MPLLNFPVVCIGHKILIQLGFQKKLDDSTAETIKRYRKLIVLSKLKGVKVGLLFTKLGVLFF